jgi:hypothetical protein
MDKVIRCRINSSTGVTQCRGLKKQLIQEFGCEACADDVLLSLASLLEQYPWTIECNPVLKLTAVEWLVEIRVPDNQCKDADDVT